MAMTEVVIAFLLLTIIFGILYHCIRFSSNLMAKAVDLGKENEYYELAVGDAFARPNAAAEPYKGGSGTTVPISFSGGGYSCSLNAKVASKSISYFQADHTTQQTQNLYYYTYYSICVGFPNFFKSET